MFKDSLSHSDSSSEIRLDLVFGLLDVYLLFHIVLDLCCILIASLKLSQLLVLFGNVWHHRFSLKLCLILLIPFGLVELLNSLILPGVSLLFFLKAWLLDLSLELSFRSKFITNLALLLFGSEKLGTSVVSDFLNQIKINIWRSTNMKSAYRKSVLLHLHGFLFCFKLFILHW